MTIRSGLTTRRTLERSPSAEQLAHAVEAVVEPAAPAPKTSSPATGREVTPAEHRGHDPVEPAAHREQPVDVPAEARRAARAAAGSRRSARSRPRSRPSHRWRRDRPGRPRAKTSSRPGTTASSSASMPSTPAQARTSSSHARISPHESSMRTPGVELLAPEVPGQRRRASPRGSVEGVGQAVGRVGGHHQGPEPGFGAAHRGGRRDRRLADTALAGEQQDPHCVSRRRRWGGASPRPAPSARTAPS